MATILPPAKTTFFDGNGAPLALGYVHFYVPGTLTRKNTWQDKDLTVLNANPVRLDADGRALIFGTGGFRQIVLRADNLTQEWDQYTEGFATASDLVGQYTTQIFTSPGQFTPGTTTQLTLTTAPLPASTSAMDIHFDGVYQMPSTYSLAGAVLTFTSAISTGVLAVSVRWATPLVNGTFVVLPSSITTAMLQDSAVTTAKLNDGAVTAAKLGSGAVTTVKILDGNVTADKLAADSVTTVKVLDGNITANKLGSDAVTTVKILDGAVTAAKLGALAVTTAKLALGAVDQTILGIGAVHSQAQKTAIALLDEFLLWDSAAPTLLKKMLPADLLAVLNLLTTDGAPDINADFLLTYDTSAAAVKKVLLSTVIPAAGSISLKAAFESVAPALYSAATNTVIGNVAGGKFAKVFWVSLIATGGFSVGDKVDIAYTGEAGPQVCSEQYAIRPNGDILISTGRNAANTEIMDFVTGMYITVTPSTFKLRVEVYG